MSDRIPQRFLDSLRGEPWMIEPARGAQLYEIAARAQVGSEFPRLAEPAVMAIRGDVASIPIEGVITRRTSLLSQNCGGSALERIAADFDEAMNNPGVSRIEFLVNSPGGEAAGIEQLAGRIFAGRGVKPSVAKIQSLGASGAYYLSAAAGKVEIAASGSAGSVGAVMTTYRRSPREGEIELVSSVSPLKRQDPGTDAGKAALQRWIDNIGSVFVDDVARFRGVTRAHALEHFGRGGMLHGREAVSARLVDALEDGSTIARPSTPAPAAPVARTARERWDSDAELRTEFGYSFERYAAYCRHHTTRRTL
jgi:ClpP class serine protease